MLQSIQRKPVDEDQTTDGVCQHLKCVSNIAVGMMNFTRLLDMMTATTVGLDGSFIFTGVKPGTYYIHAIYPGYLDPLAQSGNQACTCNDSAGEVQLENLPTVTVTGTDSAHAELRLERGAAIRGHLTYDDGTPALGWRLDVLPLSVREDEIYGDPEIVTQVMVLNGAATLVKSDDQGGFRISGIRPGEYRLRASLEASAIGIDEIHQRMGGSVIQLEVYSGNTFNFAEAKTLKLTAGEEIASYDIIIPAKHLHGIGGHVTARSDGHAINSGTVVLARKGYHTLTQNAAIRDDGSFHFDYLPSGLTYTLAILSAEDVVRQPSGKSSTRHNNSNAQILRKYATDTQDVPLSDSDVNFIQFSLDQIHEKPVPSGVKPPTP